MPVGGAKVGPEIDEVVEAQLFAGRMAELAPGWLPLIDPAPVDAMAARCQGKGCLVSAPRTTGDGFYEAVIAMPDGTRIEITA